MRWLLAIAAVSACAEPADPDPWLLDELPPEVGLSIRTPEFPVAAGEELQDCYFFQVPDLEGGADLWVDRVELGLNAGSHHMNLFRVNTIYELDPADGAPVDLGTVEGAVVYGGECWVGPNWRDWTLVANNQRSTSSDPVIDWSLPDGVAQKFTPGEWLMLQIHFVNATTQPTPALGRGGINLHWTTAEDPVELGTLFATQQSIRICRSNPTPSYTSGCGMAAGTHTVVAANGHFHSRGTNFRIFAWDGFDTDPPSPDDLFYESDRWDEPDMAIDLDVPLADGGGVRWICDYEWHEPEIGCDAVNAADPQQAGDCCYTFGPKVESNEHCNVFLYYYPKANRSDITCF